MFKIFSRVFSAVLLTVNCPELSYNDALKNEAGGRSTEGGGLEVRAHTERIPPHPRNILLGNGGCRPQVTL